MFHQDLLNPLGMGTQSEERLLQMICYSTGDEAGELDLEEMEGEVKISS